MSRRTNRIIPLLAISVFVETILRYINDSIINNVGFSRDLLDIVINALGLQSIGLIQTESINQPTWYLSVLLLCYVWLFVCTKVSKRLKIDKCYMYLFMMGIGIVTNTYMWNTLFLNRLCQQRILFIFCRCFLADYFERAGKSLRTSKLDATGYLFRIIKNKAAFSGNRRFLFLYPYVVDSCLDLSNEMDTKSKKRNMRTLSFLGKYLLEYIYGMSR